MRFRAPPLALLLLSLATPAFAQDWQSMDLGTTEDLRAVAHWPRPWIAGTNGFAAKGEWTDTGVTWTPVDLGITEDVLSFGVVSSSGHWVGGTGGTMLFTTNAGTTWQPNNLPDLAQTFVVERPNTTWIAVGNQGSIYTTPTQNGAWTERMSGTTNASLPNDPALSFFRGRLEAVQAHLAEED